jgi:hypothetical protein
VTTGFRRGELAGLRRTDVDLEHGRVSPTTPRVVVDGRARDSETKTRAGERTLALDPSTWDALRDYIKIWAQERDLLGQDTQLLFVRPSGQPIHPDTITARFHKHCADAGLPRIRLHDVRHSYASAALKAGIPPKVISERLGHAAVAFTMQTYTHVIPGMDRDAADTSPRSSWNRPRTRMAANSAAFGCSTSPGKAKSPLTLRITAGQTYGLLMAVGMTVSCGNPACPEQPPIDDDPNLSLEERTPCPVCGSCPSC